LEDLSLTLQQLITERKAKVGIIGLGYVGLPLMRAFFKAGYPVIGYDVDPAKIEKIHKGVNYLKHLGEDFIAEMSQSENFDATADFDRLGEADALLLCVPTPLGKHLEPDLSYVEVTTEAIAKTLRKGQLVVLESTTYPGTTRQVMQPVLEKTGLKCGEDFYLAYSPEREDPGRKNFNTQTIPKLVGGIGEEAGKLALELYSAAVTKAIPVSSAEVAESAKLLENIYRSVNIALVNEMKVVLDAMGIDIWEVVDAAATKPFGFQAFYPGPGLGGHCIPIDPYYLTWKAREVGHTTRFIELAGEVNHAMPDYVVNKTMLALNKNKKAIAASKILILGLAYKPNVDDIRESPSFEIIEKLQELGGDVYYNDPHVPATHKMREHDLQMESVELTADTIKQYDCVVIATNHEAYDWQMIADNAQLVIDSRGALREVTGKRDHIVSA
jgi:UDP-N-acetyl-D-glucosamine dehydrogenase